MITLQAFERTVIPMVKCLTGEEIVRQNPELKDLLDFVDKYCLMHLIRRDELLENLTRQGVPFHIIEADVAFENMYCLVLDYFIKDQRGSHLPRLVSHTKKRLIKLMKSTNPALSYDIFEGFTGMQRKQLNRKYFRLMKEMIEQYPHYYQKNDLETYLLSPKNQNQTLDAYLLGALLCLTGSKRSINDITAVCLKERGYNVSVEYTGPSGAGVAKWHSLPRNPLTDRHIGAFIHIAPKIFSWLDHTERGREDLKIDLISGKEAARSNLTISDFKYEPGKGWLAVAFMYSSRGYISLVDHPDETESILRMVRDCSEPAK